MLPRRVAMLAAVFASTLLVAVTACDKGDGATAGPADAAIQAEAQATVCPTTAPDEGASCALPDGTTCLLGACGAPIAQCIGGVWRYSGNPVPATLCPVDFPTGGSSCPPCWPADKTCTYGSTDCSAPDASANTTIANCSTGHWALATFPCGSLADSGSSDAGADVQGDAELDAD